MDIMPTLIDATATALLAAWPWFQQASSRPASSTAVAPRFAMGLVA